LRRCSSESAISQQRQTAETRVALAPTDESFDSATGEHWAVEKRRESAFT
jgi:hypothetical protein